MARRPRSSDPLDQTQLAGFAARRSERARLEVEDLLEALDWALRHPAIDPEPYAAAAREVVDQGWLAEHTARDQVEAQAADDVFHDPWIPAVDWSAFAPLAAAMGRSTSAGRSLVNDALVLSSRLPRLFEAVTAGRVEVWRARRIAAAVRMRPADVAAEVDEQVTPIADSIGLGRLEAITDEAMLRLHVEERELEVSQAQESYRVELFDSFPGFHGGQNVPVAELRVCGDILDLAAFEAMTSQIARILGTQQHNDGLLPESLEVRKARAVGILADPQLALDLLHGRDLSTSRTIHGMQLVVHLQADALGGLDPIARIDGTLRTRLSEQVATWCARPEASFSVLPVIDLTEHTESASNTVTATMAARAKLRTPTCVFPYCERPSHRCDIDHRIPVGNNLGQHGASCDCNLVPLCRHHHRLKTHAGWTYTPIETSVWLWSDPYGRSYLRDLRTTRDVTTDPHRPSFLGDNHAERREELRKRRIPTLTSTKAGCRKPQDPWTATPDPHDPPPF